MEPITFILSDESVNDYGFRILTNGIDLERFLKNPVMLYVHIRGFERLSGDPLLPIGRWENIRNVGGQLLGDAVFDEDDEFAMKVAKKVKKKILNTASIHADIIEITEDVALMVPGQTMPTITKCTLREVSIADIPGNANAVRLNYDGVSVKLGLQDSNPQDLSKLFSNHKPNQSSMKNLIAKLNGQKLQGISLADTATEAEVMLALDAVIGKNTTLTELTTSQASEIAQLTSEKTTLQAEVASVKKAEQENKAIALVDAAAAAQKITAAQKPGYLKLAQADFDSTKTILDGMTGFKSVSGQIETGEGEDEDVKLAAEYTKLFKSGKLAAVKEKNLEHFKKMFKAANGTEYKG